MANLRQNFVYPKIKDKDYRFGSQQLIGTVLRPNGDWRDYLPPEEAQEKNGIESSACFIEAQQHAIATIQEEKYSLLDQNYSARFNALFSDATEQGGDPLVGAESMRNKEGLIPDIMMPFSDEITSWADFHSFKGANEYDCLKEGQRFLKKWKLNYDLVFTREETLEEKYRKLREALKYSPVPLSVVGRIDSAGNYLPKFQGEWDTHLVTAVYLDENNCIHIRDTYSPFNKILPANYAPDFAMRWSVELLPEPTNIFKRLINWFLKEKLIIRAFKIFQINEKST